MKLLNQDKGLTLIEVIASVAVLAIIVLVVIAVLQNSAATSASTNVTDRALENARTILEEIKYKLDSEEPSYHYDEEQVVDLVALRNPALSVYEQTVYYPSNSDRQYSLTIRSERPSQSIDPIVGTSASYELSDIFRNISVTVTELRTSREPVTLRALVAYK